MIYYVFAKQNRGGGRVCVVVVQASLLLEESK